MKNFYSDFELLKQIRGKILENVYINCTGCILTLGSLRDHACFSIPWFIHCNDHWNNVIQDLSIEKPKDLLQEYFEILLVLDPEDIIDPEMLDEIIKENLKKKFIY